MKYKLTVPSKVEIIEAWVLALGSLQNPGLQVEEPRKIVTLLNEQSKAGLLNCRIDQFIKVQYEQKV